MKQQSGHIGVARGASALQLRALPAHAITIGRLPDNWLVLPSPNVARYQAELVPEHEQLLLTNLGSAEQLQLDGRPLLPHQPATLAHGAEIGIGPFLLRYSAEPMPQPAQPFAEIAALPGRVAEPVALPDRTVATLPELPAGPSRYVYDLPVLYHDEAGFLGRYLKLFEASWEPFEHRQDRIDMYFHPGTCPPGLLGWLASWLGVELDPLLPLERQRRLAAEALDLYRWRGTRYGLTRLIELATGQTPAIAEDAHEPFTIIAHMLERPASDAEPLALRRLVFAALPAHLTCRFAGEGWEL